MRSLFTPTVPPWISPVRTFTTRPFFRTRSAGTSPRAAATKSASGRGLVGSPMRPTAYGKPAPAAIDWPGRRDGERIISDPRSAVGSVQPCLLRRDRRPGGRAMEAARLGSVHPFDRPRELGRVLRLHGPGGPRGRRPHSREHAPGEPEAHGLPVPLGGRRIPRAPRGGEPRGLQGEGRAPRRGVPAVAGGQGPAAPAPQGAGRRRRPR